MRFPFTGRLATTAAGLLLAATAAAQAFPNRPVRMIVPFPAGGGTDMVGRLIAERLQANLNTPVIVENRAGAGGTIGSNYAAQADADGYTILLGISGSMVMGPHLYPNAGYIAAHRFTPLAQVGTASNILVVNPALPARSLDELVALAKAQPGQISYGSWGYGSGGHLCAEILMRNKGIKLTHVPYKGVAPVLADVLGGTIKVAMVDSTSSLPYVRTGKLRALAACTETSSNMPEVPAMRSHGVRFGSSFWYGLFAPANTPPETLARLREALASVLKEPAMAARLRELGVQPSPLSAAQFDRLVTRDYANWGNLIPGAGIHAE